MYEPTVTNFKATLRQIKCRVLESNFNKKRNFYLSLIETIQNEICLESS